MSESAAILALKRHAVEFELLPIQLSAATPTAADYSAALSANSGGPVFKTIVLKGDKTGVFVCLLAFNQKLDYKLAAKASGNRKCSMLAPEVLLEETGYIRGFCSPFGMKADFALYIDREAEQHAKIYVNAASEQYLIGIKLEDFAKVKAYVLTDLVMKA